MEITTSARERALHLLERMRETPMRRGALAGRAGEIKKAIARTIAGEGVPSALAARVGLQLAFKFHRRELYDEDVWRAIGGELREDIGRLQQHAAISMPRIIAALPKLSAEQVIDFLDELTHADPRIARTILHAAVNTSDPLAAGRRYLAEYRLVARRLGAIDPRMARTVAAATFSAGAPLSKAMEHLQRFSSLLKQHENDPRMARRLARAAFRARPPARELAR
jgi:hypothetical protein